MKIAYFSPLPPERSGIADHSMELLPHLAQVMGVTVFANEPDQVPSELHNQFEIRPLAAYPQQQWQFDLPLYHMGNSSYHDAIYQLSLRYPGVMVLHDTRLHHFMAHRTSGQGNPAGYSRELGYALGMAGINAYWQVRLGERDNDLFALPLTNRLLAVSLGLVVHSDFAKEMLKEQRPSLPLKVIPEMMTVQSGQSNRARLGWPDEAVIFASLGQVTAPKQIPLILQQLNQLKETQPHIHYLIIGADEQAEIQQLISENGWQAWVHCTGYVTGLQNFVDWLLAADVVINLRQPTMGETSAAALRALAAGKPLIVFDHGWYSEIPDEAALKVPPMAEAELMTAVRQLAESAALRQKMGRAGQHYVQTVCAPQKVTTAYYEFMAQIIARFQVNNA